MKRNLAAELTEGMQALAASRAGKTLQSIKRTLLAVPEVRAEYDALGHEFAIAREMIAARVRAGLSQAEVAQRMGTTQSVVARLESGKRPPSLRSVQRYAQAAGARAVVRLEA
ncbi:Transcriptional regulator, XRE family [Thiomonas sp. X19]|uniref:helix-turn-helix domain-containing protein n=1 Tax=Thiomonas sp. X19 TaxID=1050370 RepID=UPI000B68BF01|nr:helix-turn-helix transcriptional regulator [Thiomonas sp. X19]SCC95888.1 Transcriptional regulator, XRE family [Thiomonas sp. X19]